MTDDGIVSCDVLDWDRKASRYASCEVVTAVLDERPATARLAPGTIDAPRVEFAAALGARAVPASDGSFFDPFDSFSGARWHKSDYAVGGSWMETAFSPGNALVSGGRLELRLDTRDLYGKDFTGAEVQSVDASGFGRYGVRMKASGEVGVNSAFFVYSGNPWNEIDVEILGKDPTKLHIAYHNNGESFDADIELGFNASTGYHSYAIYWQADSITWAVDGKVVFEVTAPQVPIPQNESKLFLSIWAGHPSWMGEATFTGSTSAYVDQVRYTAGDAAPPPPGDRMSVFLINADTDAIIGPLANGARIETGRIGTDHLSILVRPVDAAAESVVFELSGAASHRQVENSAPFALFGDRGPNYWGRDLAKGSYELSVDAFSDVAGGGQKLAAIDWDLTVV